MHEEPGPTAAVPAAEAGPVGHASRPRRIVGDGEGAAPRVLAEEVAVAISYNGSTQAVMMATPADLEDFAHGFTLTEEIGRAHV